MKRYLIAVLFLLAACVPQKQWRTQPSYSAPATPTKDVERHFVIPADLAKNRIYSLAFVEFKNNGELWDQRQLDEARRSIDDADRRSDHHALVIIFLHGWKNNASQSNNNVLDFRRQLNRIAAKSCESDTAHCGVVGIYFAWSGDVITREFNTVRTLSYFDRRNTAARVAGDRISTSLFAVMKQVKTGPGRTTNHSVVVGHSFGGLILEYAISARMQELGAELHHELNTQSTAEGLHLKALEEFADLVVLINQAAPAAMAVTLLSHYRDDLSQVNLLRPPAKANCAGGDSSQDCKELPRPLILSISSESDLATKTVLPIAETIVPLRRHPEPLPSLPPGLDSKKVFTTAAAFTPQLQSHQLNRCEQGDCTPCLKEDKDYIPISITLPAYAPGSSGNSDTQAKYCLTRVGDRNAWNQTPYWIFTIPTEIVPDHGTIFTDRFTDFLTAFMPPLQNFSPTRPALPTQRFYHSSRAR